MRGAGAGDEALATDLAADTQLRRAQGLHGLAQLCHALFVCQGATGALVCCAPADNHVDQQ